MPMRRISYALFGLTLAFGVVGLGACSKNPQPSPVPVLATPAGTTSVGVGSDASVPAAASVLTPAPQASVPASSAGRDNKAMSRTEESTAMPMPGQNNDHSAPLPPSRSASAR